jgi:diguanylate cyclase (GGDEF)-like protein
VLCASLALGLAAVFGFCDFLTGPELFSSQFYLLPIGFAAWYGGFRVGMVAALVCAITWSFVSIWEQAEPLAGPYVYLWNALSCLAIFAAFAFLLHRLRDALAREKELAIKDPLTGAFNRRRFYLLSDQEIERARSTGESFTVAYFDLDGFKKVNDTLGHVRGDKLLILVVDTVAKNIRRKDLLARLGGDEFAILQPDTNPADAEECLSRLWKVLASETTANGFPVTYSIGVVTFNKAPENIEAMIRRADELMYKVKLTGKNSIRYEVVD